MYTCLRKLYAPIFAPAPATDTECSVPFNWLVVAHVFCLSSGDCCVVKSANIYLA